MRAERPQPRRARKTADSPTGSCRRCRIRPRLAEAAGDTPSAAPIASSTSVQPAGQPRAAAGRTRPVPARPRRSRSRRPAARAAPRAPDPPAATAGWRQRLRVLAYAASEVGGRFGPGMFNRGARREPLPATALPAHLRLARWLDAPVDWAAEFEADLADLQRLIELAASRPADRRPAARPTAARAARRQLRVDARSAST